MAEELGGLEVRFKPLLPLGRERRNDATLSPDVDLTTLRTNDDLLYEFRLLKTCGIGQNLYVGPGGEAYPCYALVNNTFALGNVFDNDGLPGVIDSKNFQVLSTHTVDTNDKCKQCTLRYLCGGFCRVWCNDSTNEYRYSFNATLDCSPIDCHAYHAQARLLLVRALKILGITLERWIEAGLPLPDHSPEIG